MSCACVSFEHGVPVCGLDAAATQLESEVVHWHAQQSTELGACLRAFVSSEQTASAMQVEVWTRVLGQSASDVNNGLPFTAAAAAAAAFVGS